MISVRLLGRRRAAGGRDATHDELPRSTVPTDPGRGRTPGRAPRHPDGPGSARVLEACSVLVGDSPVRAAGTRPRSWYEPGDSVEFLPPFAGGLSGRHTEAAGVGSPS